MPDNVSGTPDNVNLACSPFGTCFVFGGIVPLLIAKLSDVLFSLVSGSQFTHYVYPDSWLLVYFTSLPVCRSLDYLFQYFKYQKHSRHPFCFHT